VGAAGTNTGLGSATVFVRSGAAWSIEGTLTAGTSANAELGTAVAIVPTLGDRIIVGAPNDAIGGVSGAGSAHVYVRNGSVWTAEATLVPQTPSANMRFGWSIALTDNARALIGGATSSSGTSQLFVRSGTTWSPDALVSDVDITGTQNVLTMTPDGSRALLGAPARQTGLINTGAMAVVVLGNASPNGTACTATDGSTCQSGFCVDGYCCNSACGGGTTTQSTDCMDCSAAHNGVANGMCLGLSASYAPTVTCLAATGACDVAQVCVAGSTTCPAQTFRPSTYVCRASAPPAPSCDAPEYCTGSSAACPLDVLQPRGFVCQTAIGACQISATCDGMSATCPTITTMSAGAVCRGVVPGRLGDCDVAEMCDGASPDCPPDTFRPAGTLCHMSSGAVCDADAMCTGTGPSCPPTFAPATTICGASTGVCDGPHHCSGMDANCQPAYISGVLCRPSAGPCDVAESCSGASGFCPLDMVLAAGVVCRASVGACDPEESCDGTSTACPPDVNMCVQMPDTGVGGHDAGGSTIDGGPTDGGRDAGPDAGSRDGSATDAGATGIDTGAAPPPAAGGCGCRASRRGGSHVAILMAIVLIASRRRRLR
jgi:hypothetical protein